MTDIPRVTTEQIDSLIVSEQYHRFPGTTLTVCCLTLRNGYNVIGQSASVSALTFSARLGETLAREDARDKIWALEGYLLREQLHRASPRTY